MKQRRQREPDDHVDASVRRRIHRDRGDVRLCGPPPSFTAHAIENDEAPPGWAEPEGESR